MATDSPFTQPPVQQAPPQQGNAWKIVAIVVGVLAVSMVLCIGVLTALLLPAVSQARTAARSMQSSNNLKQIGLALHNYHDVHKALPPAYSTDSEGKPLLSWRVAILPYVESSPLYDQFHHDEPWDSPHNLSLLDQMPDVYRSPNATETPSSESNYLAISAPRSLFPSTGETISFQDCPDGISNTLAVLEVFDATVPWTQPDDVSPAQAFKEISESPVPRHNAVMGDGSVRALERTTARSEVDAMITRDGGD
ncbi:MAG: DUF1559 domain-containing protein [Pirellulaceae bacterium]